MNPSDPQPEVYQANLAPEPSIPPPPQNNPFGPRPPQYDPYGPYPPQKSIGDDAAMRMLLPVGRSIWAIIAGYLGLLSVILLPAPLAVIMGIVAIIDIRKHPEKHGMGRAIFGIVMGAIFSVVFVIVLIGMLNDGMHRR